MTRSSLIAVAAGALTGAALLGAPLTARAHDTCRPCTETTPAGPERSVALEEGAAGAGPSWLVFYRAFGPRCCDSGRVVAPPNATVVHVAPEQQRVILSWQDGHFEGGEATTGLVAFDTRTGQLAGSASGLSSRKPCKRTPSRFAALRRTPRDPRQPSRVFAEGRFDLVLLDLGAPDLEPRRLLSAAALADAQAAAKSLRWRRRCEAVTFSPGGGAKAQTVALAKPAPADDGPQEREIPLVVEGTVIALELRGEGPLTRLRISTDAILPREVAAKLPKLDAVSFDLTVEEMEALRVGRFEAGSSVQAHIVSPSSLDPSRFTLESLTPR